MNAFYNLLFPQMLWHSADTSGLEVVVPRLHALEAAEPFITRLQSKYRIKELDKSDQDSQRHTTQEQRAKTAKWGQANSTTPVHHWNKSLLLENIQACAA
ncbi:hypothetical protein ACLOJK_038532 [Asimina triloba]